MDWILYSEGITGLLSRMIIKLRIYSYCSKDAVQALSSDEKVIVISVFGKSLVTACSLKASAFDVILGKHVIHQNRDKEDELEEDFLCEIDGYYDGNQRVIFLHLRGVFDTQILIQAYNLLAKDLEEKSHMCLIVSHPKHTFDISYIQLFRALDVARQKAQPLLSEILRGINGIPRDWVMSARPCAPRVLFLFQSCPRAHLVLVSAARAKQSNAKHSSSNQGEVISAVAKSVKKLEHALEDQIYHILRKTRVITNVSSNSLFAIPANQEFVFVNTQSLSSSQESAEDRVTQMIQSMMQFCDNPYNVEFLDNLIAAFSEYSYIHIDDCFLLSKNPGAVRVPEEDRGREMLPMDLWVVVGNSASSAISRHIPSLCAEATDATYARESDMELWAAREGGLSTRAALLAAVKRLPPAATPVPRCADIISSVPFSSMPWTKPCICRLEICVGWYPCGLKYCKGGPPGKEGAPAAGANEVGSNGKGPSAGSYRCGIKTCRKCRLFEYYVRQKQLCLWDE